jgi:hypothetical protein
MKLTLAPATRHTKPTSNGIILTLKVLPALGMTNGPGVDVAVGDTGGAVGGEEVVGFGKVVGGVVGGAVGGTGVSRPAPGSGRVGAGEGRGGVVVVPWATERDRWGAASTKGTAISTKTINV